MAIRAATILDIPQIHGIYAYYVQQSTVTLDETTPPVQTFESIFASVTARHSPFLVAVDSTSTSIKGYAYAGSFNDRSGYWPCAEDSIYIHPDHRGKGIGKILLAELLKQLKESNVKSQVLAKMSIGVEQRPEELPSYLLHTKFGFRIVGRLEQVGCKFGEKLDVLIMQVGL